MRKAQMRELLDTALDGAAYIDRALTHGAADATILSLLENLHQAADLLAERTQDTSQFLPQISLYFRNIGASIDEALHDPAQLRRIFSMEIRPFLIETDRLWAFQADVLSSEEGIARYRQEMMRRVKALRTAPCEQYRYDVSIVVLAYNKLEYTKVAIESIFAHTDFSAGNIELITINNGSDDGTRAFFDRLPHRKKVNLTYNVLGLNLSQHIIEGKYYILFSNDVVATPHWLENLLAAMQSDERIAMAVPICNEEGATNLQGVPVPYRNTLEDMEKMQAFAAEHNRRNDRLWEERSQLMPFISILRSDLYCAGLLDPAYTRSEFVDDDESTLLRRNGWRQLLLKDTFMHHFGGVTLGAGRYKGAGNAIADMRRVYYTKWGVDAWDSRGTFSGMEVLNEWHDVRDGERILVLEPRFGDSACSILNMYRRRGMRSCMTAVVFDTRYCEDTGYLFDHVIRAKQIEDVSLHTTEKYDVISTGCYLDELPMQAVIRSLELLYQLLAPGGILFLPVRNPGSAYELDAILHRGMRDVYCLDNEVRQCVSISYRHLLRALHAHPFLHHYQFTSIGFKADEQIAERMKPLLRTDEDLPPDAELSLSVRMLFLGITKKTEQE